MVFRETLDALIMELRITGLDISPGEVEDCYRALSQIDWFAESVFYQTLACTLVKDYEWLPIFRQLFEFYFKQQSEPLPFQEEYPPANDQMLPGFYPGKNKGPGKKNSRDSRDHSESLPAKRTNAAKKSKRNLLELDFYTSTYQTPLEDIRRLEQLVPLMGRRMAAQIKIKRRKKQSDRMDFRRTIRRSLSYGGTPVELLTLRKVREKPVIFALCDLSRSCLYFSYFSLAIVHILETYFRQVRSFAFVDETDEITDVVKNTPISQLRQKVMFTANTSILGSYTNYEQAFETFYDKYGKDLSHKCTIVIFGDGRTNWFGTGAQILKEIQGKVKRVYWFNPELRDEWQNGDSSMESYAKYCHGTFECSNLDQLASAITKIM